jgi:thiol-disulfide isomerase/thioredoxin
MNRRQFAFTTASIALSTDGTAGVMDWYNGVKLGRALPEFDTQFLRDPPPPEAKLTLIDFWATWCAPCREEFPHLNRLSQRFGPEGLSVIGLTQEPVKVVWDFLGKVTIGYPVGAAGEKPLQKQLGIKALPYAVLVNRTNVVIWRGQASTLTEQHMHETLRSAA